MDQVIVNSEISVLSFFYGLFFPLDHRRRDIFCLMQNKSKINRRVAVACDNCLIHLPVGYLQNMSAEYRQFHFLIQPSCLYEEKTNWYKWNRSFSFRLTSIPSFHIATNYLIVMPWSLLTQTSLSKVSDFTSCISCFKFFPRSKITNKPQHLFRA